MYILHFSLLIAWKSCSFQDDDNFISLTNIFSGSFVNDKFLNLKLNVFIIADFTCSTKYLKQISPPHYKRDGDWSCTYSPKNRGVFIFLKNGGDW